MRSRASDRQLHAERPALPDVPAIYFVSPSSHNLERIAQDLRKNLYSSSYINFTSALPRPLLEEFAEHVARDGTADRVEQVYDQHLDFLCLSKSLFSLTPSLATTATATATVPSPNPTTPGNTYTLLNSPTTSEQAIEALTDSISKGLFSVLVTMSTANNGNGGGVPIIRAPRGNAAEMVARKLDRLLRDHLASSGSRGLNAFNSSSASSATSGGDGFGARPRQSSRTVCDSFADPSALTLETSSQCSSCSIETSTSFPCCLIRGPIKPSSTMSWA